MIYSGLVDYVRILENKCTKMTNKVNKKITIHHMAGELSVETCGNVFANPNRKASSNYAIGSDGRVACYVPEEWRAWTSSNAANDKQAITIEVANDSGAPNWHVSDKALNKLIDLCVDICKRNNIESLVFTGNKNGNVTLHKYFAATQCPGPYLESKIPYIVEMVNKQLIKKPTSEEIVQDVLDSNVTEDKNSFEYREQYIWHRLLGHFKNPYGVAGLMGNLQAESGFSPINLQNSYNKKFGLSDEEYTAKVDSGEYTNFVKDSAGYGLAQWTYWSRKQALLDYANSCECSIGDLDMQVEFLIYEITGYKRVYNAILNYQEINAVSNIVLTEYEKPADQSDKVKEQRYKNALNIYNKFVYSEELPKEEETTVSNNTGSFKVKILADGLNIRAGAGTKYKTVGCIKDNGVYTIVETNSTGTWGKLKSGAGWISLNAKYVKRL